MEKAEIEDPFVKMCPERFSFGEAMFIKLFNEHNGLEL